MNFSIEIKIDIMPVLCIYNLHANVADIKNLHEFLIHKPPICKFCCHCYWFSLFFSLSLVDLCYGIGSFDSYCHCVCWQCWFCFLYFSHLFACIAYVWEPVEIISMSPLFVSCDTSNFNKNTYWSVNDTLHESKRENKN